MDSLIHNDKLIDDMYIYTKEKIQECMDIILSKMESEIIKKNLNDIENINLLNGINIEYNIYFKEIINKFVDGDFTKIIVCYKDVNSNVYLEPLIIINFMFETLKDMFVILKKKQNIVLGFNINYCYDILIDFCSKITL